MISELESMMRTLAKTLKENTVLFGPASVVDRRSTEAFLENEHFSFLGRVKLAFVETFPGEDDVSNSPYLDASKNTYLGANKNTSFFGLSGNNKGVLRKIWLLIKVPVTTVSNIIRFTTEFVPHVIESVFKHLLVSSKRGLHYAFGFKNRNGLDISTSDAPNIKGVWDFFTHTLVGFVSLLGIMVGAAVYYPMKAARLLIRTVTSPVASLNDGWNIHPVLGVLSGIISCAAYVVSSIFLPPVVLTLASKGGGVARIAAKIIPHAARRVTGIITGFISSIGMAIKKYWKRIKSWVNPKKETESGEQFEEAEQGEDSLLRARADSDSTGSTFSASTGSSRGSSYAGQQMGDKAGVHKNPRGRRASKGEARRLLCDQAADAGSPLAGNKSTLFSGSGTQPGSNSEQQGSTAADTSIGTTPG